MFLYVFVFTGGMRRNSFLAFRLPRCVQSPDPITSEVVVLRLRASSAGETAVRYGNLLRAWKLGLDTDGSGKISFVEFCSAARAQVSWRPGAGGSDAGRSLQNAIL